MASASTSGVDAHAGPTPRQRGTANGGASTSNGGPSHTPAQLAYVKRILACRHESYYEILAIEKSASDSDVRRAYKKASLMCHPDKNLAPGASDAFKMVSKAFTVLSDTQKRAIFDDTGADPDDRRAQAGSFARGGGMGGMNRGFGANEDMAAEEIFRAFFGGGGGPFGPGFGGGGGGFGGAGTTFTFFGPGGVRMQTHGGGFQRPRPGAGGAQGQNGQPTSIWVQLAPLIILFLVSMLTSLPSIISGLFEGADAFVPDPSFSFEQSTRHNLERTTTGRVGVTHFVNAKEFAQHPAYYAYVSANPELNFKTEAPHGSQQFKNDLVQHVLSLQSQQGQTAEPANAEATDEGVKTTKAEVRGKQKKFKIPPSLARFDRTVEQSYIARLQARCQRFLTGRQQRLEAARGFFGIGADWDKVKRITNERSGECVELGKLGYNVQY